MDCSPPGSSVHGILQARILGWVAISFFRGSFQPSDQTCISHIDRRVLYHWATREPISKYRHALCSPTLYILKRGSGSCVGWTSWLSVDGIEYRDSFNFGITRCHNRKSAQQPNQGPRKHKHKNLYLNFGGQSFLKGDFHCQKLPQGNAISHLYSYVKWQGDFF